MPVPLAPHTAAAGSSSQALVVARNSDSDSDDSDSDDSAHMDSDEERAARAPPPVRIDANGRKRYPKRNMKLGERSDWKEQDEPRSRAWLKERMRLAMVNRGSFQNKMAGTTPCEATAQQYIGHLCHILSKGRDNPYTNFATLKQWACNADEKAMRAHICKQFCWKPNAPEVKSWVATTMSALRILRMVEL